MTPPEQLREQLAYPEDEVRHAAVQALRDCGAEALPLLIGALGDASWRVRKAALDLVLLAPAAGSLPLLIEEAAGMRVDRCPLNFTGLTTLPGAAVIHLERLNSALVAANRHYLATCFPYAEPAERIPLRQLVTFPAANPD